MATPPKSSTPPTYRAAATQNPASVSDNIQLCADGKYRWTYEFKMLKNPAIFITVFKIFAFVFLGIWAFMMIINLIEGADRETMLGSAKVLLILLGVFTVLIVISYIIFAAINGWKYMVLFEMDEEGVLHRQLERQVKRAQAIGWLTVLVGIAAHKPTTVGVGINSMTKQQSYSSFKNVRSVKPKRRYNTIKVNELLEKNQVYVNKADFDFVLNYILAHCPRVKK